MNQEKVRKVALLVWVVNSGVTTEQCGYDKYEVLIRAALAALNCALQHQWNFPRRHVWFYRFILHTLHRSKNIYISVLYYQTTGILLTTGRALSYIWTPAITEVNDLNISHRDTVKTQVHYSWSNWSD